MKPLLHGVLALQIFLVATVLLPGDLIYVDMPSLIRNATDIIEGSVVKIEPEWDAEHRFIYSYITISVEKYHKGDPPKKVVLKEMGGTLDGFTTIIPDQATYKVGEDVFVFLRRDDAFYKTYGMTQGKFNVEMNNGVKQLRRNIDIDRLILLDSSTSRENIQKVVRYSNMQALITNYAEENNDQ